VTGVKLALPFLVGALSAASGCGSRSVCPTPTVPPDAGPLANEPLGQPCVGPADCSRGGTCAQLAFPFLTTCTTACGSTSCPTGTTCRMEQAATVDGGLCNGSCNGGLTSVPVCVASCFTDADCQQGTRAGQCTGIGGGAGTCNPLECLSDSECPSAYFCFDAFSVCCEPGQACPEIASRPGWCRRRP